MMEGNLTALNVYLSQSPETLQGATSPYGGSLSDLRRGVLRRNQGIDGSHHLALSERVGQCRVLRPVPLTNASFDIQFSGILENNTFTFETQASEIDLQRALKLGKCLVKL